MIEGKIVNLRQSHENAKHYNKQRRGRVNLSLRKKVSDDSIPIYFSYVFIRYIPLLFFKKFICISCLMYFSISICFI